MNRDHDVLHRLLQQVTACVMNAVGAAASSRVCEHDLLSYGVVQSAPAVAAYQSIFLFTIDGLSICHLDRRERS